MRTIEQNYWVQETQKENLNKFSTNEKVNNILNNSKITEELAELFWVNKEKVIALTQKENNELSNQSEVNKQEAQLAKMFGKYPEMIALNNNNETKRPISINSVMDEFDAYMAA